MSKRTCMASSVSQRMNRCGNPAAAANEVSRGKRVHSHNWRAAKQAAKLHHLTNLTTGNRNDAHGRRFVIHYPDSHFIRNDCRDRLR
jgi:hypothetical protein